MKIELQDYSWECGDGCCYDWGVYLSIDGTKIDNRVFAGSGDALAYVLETLGHTVERREEDDD